MAHATVHCGLKTVILNAVKNLSGNMAYIYNRFFTAFRMTWLQRHMKDLTHLQPKLFVS